MNPEHKKQIIDLYTRSLHPLINDFKQPEEGSWKFSGGPSENKFSIRGTFSIASAGPLVRINAHFSFDEDINAAVCEFSISERVGFIKKDSTTKICTKAAEIKEQFKIATDYATHFKARVAKRKAKAFTLA